MTLSELFDTFHTSAFRLEGRSVYLVDEEDEAFKAYQITGRLPDDFGNDWAEFVRSKTSSGKTVQRLRLLSDNLSDYEAFELKAYAGLKGGEDIRFAKRSNHPYESDFWFFDNRWLARMEYDKDGRYIDSIISEVSSKDQGDIDGWLALYGISPSISEIIPLSK